jgi:hypothetical protein
VVSDSALVIVVELFDQGNHEHKHQGCHVGDHKANFEDFDELTEGDEQEKEVKEELELVEKHNWDETVPSVTRVLHRVLRVLKSLDKVLLNCHVP